MFSFVMFEDNYMYLFNLKILLHNVLSQAGRLKIFIFPFTFTEIIVRSTIIVTSHMFETISFALNNFQLPLVTYGLTS